MDAAPHEQYGAIQRSLPLAHVTEPESSRDPYKRFARSEAFVAKRASKPIEEYEPEFERYVQRIGRFIRLRPGTRILEVGTGTGWFMVQCRLRGLKCDGIEHNPFSVKHAKELGRRHGFELSIRTEGIEEVELPEGEYDVVVAMSVLEHVEHYRRALDNIHRTLKPGGVFYCYSTNKFSVRSGEYPLPLYGLLPYSARRALRVRLRGESIVESGGIDFNQFTYFGLRRALRQAGFSRVYDKFQFLQPEDVVRPTRWRILAARALRAAPPLRIAARVVDSGTCFIAIK
jgi:SAM-dependent methyltransferase